MSEPRILIVKLGALGDVILALPALRLLRRSLPDARIGWLVERRNAAPLGGNLNLDLKFVIHSDAWRKHPWSRGAWRGVGSMVGALRRTEFTLALDLQGLVKSALWAWLSGARERVGLPPGRSRERLGALLLTRRAPLPPSHHVTDLYLAAAAEAVRVAGGVPVALSREDEQGLIRLTDEETAWAEQAIARHALGGFAVVNPGTAWATKQWPPERLAELARALVARHGLRVVVAYGPGEEGLAARVVAAASSAAVVSFPTDVRQLAALLARARLFVGGDTGPYHLARAMGTPTIGLFGPTDPARNGPWPREGGASDLVVWGKVPCSPCYRRVCPTHIECMDAIAPAAVVERADALLAPRA